MTLIKKFIIGDTPHISWVDSSITIANSADYTIYSGSETIVSTGTLTSSDNGHYYANFTIPDSYGYGYYNCETLVNIGGIPYKNKTPFKVIPLEVD